MSDCREVRCAFVVIKLKINNSDYFLLRRDKDWDDLSLVGGHQEEKDKGSFKRTARREIFEELSALRGTTEMTLVPLMEEIVYGPTWSKSAGCESLYRLSFYLFRAEIKPVDLEVILREKTMNFLLDLKTVKLFMERKDVSAFLYLLESEVPGGLEAIPYSWDDDLGETVNKHLLSKRFHKQLSLFSHFAS